MLALTGMVHMTWLTYSSVMKETHTQRQAFALLKFTHALHCCIVHWGQASVPFFFLLFCGIYVICHLEQLTSLPTKTIPCLPLAAGGRQAHISMCFQYFLHLQQKETCQELQNVCSVHQGFLECLRP